MTEEVIFDDDQIAVIQAAAEVVVPADDFDGGLGELSPGYVVATRVRYQPAVAHMYLKGLKGIQDSVDLMFGPGKTFATLEPEERLAVLRAMQQGAAPGEGWKEVNPAKFWAAMRQDLLFVYGTDPDVCKRIGFEGRACQEGGYIEEFDKPQEKYEPQE